MNTSLVNLLNASSDLHSSHATHVTYFGPSHQWDIVTESLSSFWLGYCQLVHDEEDRLCVGEKIVRECPIIVDVDLIFDLSSGSNRHNDEFMLALIGVYQTVIANELLLDPSMNGVEHMCCVLETGEPYADSQGLHSTFTLMFPYCRVELEQQRSLIKPAVISLSRRGNILSKLSSQPINDWDSIIEVPRDSYPLYGSVRDSKRQVNVLSKIYGLLTEEEIDLIEAPEELEPSAVFSPTNHSQIQNGSVPATTFDDLNLNPEDEDNEIAKLIPFFLSIHFWTRTTSPSRRATPAREALLSVVGICDESDREMSTRFLSMISNSRLEKEHIRDDIGKALHNIHEGDEAGYTAWCNMLGDYDSTLEMKYYVDFTVDNHLTLKTLAWYARIDSPEEYKNWHTAWCSKAFEKASTLTHTDVAQALYRYFWLEFVCASHEKKSWYRFMGHTWIRMDGCHDLRMKVSGEFVRVFESLRTKLSLKIQESNDPNWKIAAEVLLTGYGKIISKLKMLTFKTSLVKEASEAFYDRKFNSLVDSNPALMGCMNCVIEACSRYATTRDGKPEDYITKCIPITYKEEYTSNSPQVRAVLEWFSKMFPDKEACDYAIRLLSSCLYGKNSNKIFPVLTGAGDNSKSMLKKAIECAFGPYCITLPTSLVTNKRSSSSAPTPELGQAKGSRIAFLQEADGDDPMKSGTIKEFTGGDTFFCRMLHDNGSSVTAMFTLFLMCNKVPIIPNSDKAIKNRLRILPFLSKWSHDAPDDIEEQYRSRNFKMDSRFENKIPALAPALLWLLVNSYSSYIKLGLAQPQVITDHTTEYWNENDPLLCFINECVEEVRLPDGTHNTSVFLKMTDLYSEFSSWYREGYPGLRPPNTATLKNNIMEKWGRPSARGWPAKQIKLIITDL